MKNGDKIKITWLKPAKNAPNEVNAYIGMSGEVHDYNGKTFSILTDSAWLVGIDLKDCTYTEIEPQHPHAQGKEVGMAFLRRTQIPTTTFQRDLLFKMIDDAIKLAAK